MSTTATRRPAPGLTSPGSAGACGAPRRLRPARPAEHLELGQPRFSSSISAVSSAWPCRYATPRWPQAVRPGSRPAAGRRRRSGGPGTGAERAAASAGHDDAVTMTITPRTQRRRGRQVVVDEVHRGQYRSRLAATRATDGRRACPASPRARFVPADRLGRTPTRGRRPAAARVGAVLSHWPGSGTPEALAADTSAQIAVRYLAADPRARRSRRSPTTITTRTGSSRSGSCSSAPRPATRAAPGGRRRGGGGLPHLDRPAGRAGRNGGDGDGRARDDAVPRRAPRPGPAAARDPSGAIYEALLPRVGRLLADPAATACSGPRPGSAWSRPRPARLGEARIDEVPEPPTSRSSAPRGPSTRWPCTPAPPAPVS